MKNSLGFEIKFELKNYNTIDSIQYNPHMLQYASDELRNDREIITLATQKVGAALKYASDELKKDAEFMYSLIIKNPHTFSYIGENLLDDPKFIISCLPYISFRYGILENASDRLKDDKEFVLAIIKNNDSSFRYASDRLKKDKDVVLEAVKNSKTAFKYDIKDELRNDRDVVLAAVKQDETNITHIPNDLKEKYGKTPKEFIKNIENEIIEEKMTPEEITIKRETDRQKAQEELKEKQLNKIKELCESQMIPAKEVLQDGNGRAIIQIPKLKDDNLPLIDNIKDWQGNPAFPQGTKGFIFDNGVDKQKQAVQVDGSGIIIINNVNEKDAKKINKMIQNLQKFEKIPTLYINELKNIIDKVHDMGYVDTYNSNTNYLENSLLKNQETGLYSKAITVESYLVKEDGILENNNGTLIENPEFNNLISSAAAAFYKDGLSIDSLKNIVNERYPEVSEFLCGQKVQKGDIIVVQSDSIHKIEPNTFFEQYKKLNGDIIEPSDYKDDRPSGWDSGTSRGPSK